MVVMDVEVEVEVEVERRSFTFEAGLYKDGELGAAGKATGVWASRAEQSRAEQRCWIEVTLQA